MGNNVEIFFGQKTREGDSVTVIQNAPRRVYESMRAKFDNMQANVPGLEIKCTPLPEDTIGIAIILKKDSPDKYQRAIENFISMFAEEIERVLSEEMKKLPVVRPLEEEIAVVEKRTATIGNSIERRNAYALICINTPRILKDNSAKERQERMKLQEVFGRALDGLKRHLMEQKIYVKITNALNVNNKDYYQTYVNLDEEQVEKAVPLLEEFVVNNGEKIDEEYSLVLESVGKGRPQFSLKLRKKGEPQKA